MFSNLPEFIYLSLQKIILIGLSVLAFLNIQISGPTNIFQAEEILIQNIETPVVQEEKKTPPPEKEIGQAKKSELPPNKTIIEPPQKTQIIAPQIVATPRVEQVITPPLPLIPQAQLNETARKAVVNVFCLTKTGTIFEPITGSGVLIDERGVILTNAHVAQYLLLKDYKIKNFLDCVIRVGSPANPLYRAELLYMPPIWIEENALNVKIDKPMGTGENDFALLLITGRTAEGAVLPQTFSAIQFDTELQNSGLNDPVLIASYPAGFLGGLDITKNLWISSSVARIMKLYTFKDTEPYTQDAFSVGGTVVAQEGASGGGVFSLKSGKLIGLLATSLLEGKTDERDLRAISLRHIDERIEKYTGENLAEFLSENLKQKSTDFNSTIAPQLTKILTDTLDKK
ncbi:MAG: trypsin-like peptidase domain-containing protein [bacterium]|nr:trypsin-like peptidase domain-containing protein [bacterium]